MQTENIVQRFVFDQYPEPIHVYRRENEILFSANEIGNMLELTKVRKSMVHFTAKEKTTMLLQTSGGLQECAMLTERGLNRLLINSNKPIAATFREWVLDVIEAIQKKGYYDVQHLKEEYAQIQERLANANIERYKEEAKLLQERKELRSQILEKDIIINDQNNKIASTKDTHIRLLKAYDGRYVVYFGKIREHEGRQLVKIGRTKDLFGSFTGRHTADYGQIELIHVVECSLNEPLEQYVLQHPNVLKFRFSGPVKVDGSKSNEVVLVNKDELKTIYDIAVNRVKHLKSMGDPDVQMELKEMSEDISVVKNKLCNHILTEINEAKQSIAKCVILLEQHNSKVTEPISDNSDETDKEEKPTQKPKRVRIRVKGTGKCAACNDQITNRAVYCVKCEVASRPKKFDISKEELNELVNVQKIPFTTLGKRFGVSDNAIRKRCRALGVTVRKIHKPRQGAPAPNEQ